MKKYAYFRVDNGFIVDVS